MSGLIERAKKIRRDEGTFSLIRISVKFITNYPGRVLADLDTPFGVVVRCLIYEKYYVEREFRTKAGSILTKIPEGSYFDKNTPKEYEPQVTKILKKHLDKTKSFWDIGAHFGYFVQVAQSLGVPPSCIHAFEASRMNHYSLRRNLDTNVTIVHAIVSDRTTEAELRLDDYRTENDVTPDVIKMDIDGGELAALQGMKNILTTDTPVLLVEVHPLSLGDDETAILELLRSHGYILFCTVHHPDRIEGDGYSFQMISDIQQPSMELYDSETEYLLYALPSNRGDINFPCR